jgi:hypothetical protein
VRFPSIPRGCEVSIGRALENDGSPDNVEIELQSSPRRIERASLALAAVVPDLIRSLAAAGHFASDRLEAPLRLALAFVHEPDCGVACHRPGDNRHGIFADRLVHIIFAIGLAANLLLEAERGHRARADLLITISGVPPGSVRRLFNRNLLRPLSGFWMTENAGDGLECVIGWVVLDQISTSGKRWSASGELRCWR